MRVPSFLRFPRRGGNYNNTSNAGLGYVNGNNDRSNTNTNYGVRSGSPSVMPRIKRGRLMCKRLRLLAMRIGGKGAYFLWREGHTAINMFAV